MILFAFVGFFLLFSCRTPIFLSRGILLLLVFVFFALSQCIILLLFCHDRFLCSCRQNIAGSHATSTRGIERLFPASRHTLLPELLVSISRLHARTWRGEYVFPSSCSFSEASLLLIERRALHRKKFSHKLLVGLSLSHLGSRQLFFLARMFLSVFEG